MTAKINQEHKKFQIYGLPFIQKEHNQTVFKDSSIMDTLWPLATTLISKRLLSQIA